MVSVAIIVGFTEGNWHTKKFRKALRSQGFSLATDPRKADIVIAHSGGAMYVSNLTNEQRIILIDPLFWPGRSLSRRTCNMIIHVLRSIRPGNRPFYQIFKTTHNVFYLFWHGRTTLDMIRRGHSFDLKAVINKPSIILVRNSEDPWLTPDFKQLQQLNPQLTVIELTGGHDDCWLHPAPYVNLLQSEM